MTQTTITLQQRRAILAAAKQHQANIRIEVLPSVADAPRTVGSSYYWTTTGTTGKPSGN